LIVKNGALIGLKPYEIWEIELWEYNMFIEGREIARKNDAAQAILTGYYAAYYNNNGKKAKAPDELIRKLFQKKQALSEGLAEIRALRDREENKELYKEE
jgi:hypothetical protein